MKDRKLVLGKLHLGFSLPEVAIAIAVAGVALMAVVGLLPGLLDADRGSGINSLMSSLSTQVLGELEAQPYRRPPPYEAAPPQPVTFFFSADGSLVKEQAKAQYRCEVSLSAIPLGGTSSAGGSSTAPSPGPDCSLVTMDFTWPIGSKSKLNRRVLHATLANRSN
jgi:uncharacterized protein (TIGR02598 family)